MDRSSRDKTPQEARQRWPLLSNLLGGYFGQDYLFSYGSLDGAFTAASGDYPLADRRALLKEYRNWYRTETAGRDIRRQLADAFGVALSFGTPKDGRRFMDRLHKELLSSVGSEKAA